MMKTQLKDLPSKEQEKLLSAFEENPELFESIAREIQIAVNEGKDQTSAALEVMQKHREEIQKLLL